MSKLAPIILFAYNRPNHLLATLQALSNNKLADQSTLFIYCDGPKSNANEQTLKKIKEVREVVKSQQWCSQNIVIERDQNLGLAKSIIKGVEETLDQFGKIIILEDDLVPSPNFLDFMNKGLTRYENEERVAGISGWSLNIDSNVDVYFSRFGSCWGWGTWSRVWKQTTFDANHWVKTLKENNLVYKFDFDASYPFYSMLKDQTKGNVDSWAICFDASFFARGELFLFPGKSLITNIGIDGSGTNTPSFQSEENDDFSEIQMNNQVITIPENISVAENKDNRNKIKVLLRKENSISKPRALLNTFNKMINNYSNHHI